MLIASLIVVCISNDDRWTIPVWNALWVMSFILTPAHSIPIGTPICFAMYPPAILPIAPVGKTMSKIKSLNMTTQNTQTKQNRRAGVRLFLLLVPRNNKTETTNIIYLGQSLHKFHSTWISWLDTFLFGNTKVRPNKVYHLH